MILTFNQKFISRKEIGDIFGGDLQKGIAKSSKTNAILLFMNKDRLYKDYFYPAKTHSYCMYTGIGPTGHQDSIKNPMYDLNMDVLTHKANNRHLLLFEKVGSEYCFRGEYDLIETHQNIQVDKDNISRRVFVFHLKQVSDSYIF